MKRSLPESELEPPATGPTHPSEAPPENEAEMAPSCIVCGDPTQKGEDTCSDECHDKAVAREAEKRRESQMNRIAERGI